jgi:hypothetical protein
MAIEGGEVAATLPQGSKWIATRVRRFVGWEQPTTQAGLVVGFTAQSPDPGAGPSEREKGYLEAARDSSR